ncbi:hypothetical protein B1H18_22570 [Streptomyces tsukubensis]|uniref:Uncharacterized protein n=1 Tax=Streptomyces tsukubensis TaxID=83656 RepID=A0A1V4A5G7_9ACTN|nr:hypothetical protein B1H18_22570 [Streptomyces tsukubensis]
MGLIDCGLVVYLLHGGLCTEQGALLRRPSRHSRTDDCAGEAEHGSEQADYKFPHDHIMAVTADSRNRAS